MAHQLTCRTRGGVDTYAHPGTGITVAHHTDALSRLCRKLVAFGASGPAEVRGEDGRLRFTVPAIEYTARRTLRDDDGRGLRWRGYVPHPESGQTEAA